MTTIESHFPSPQKVAEIEKNIDIIEQNGERILALYNDLMSACLQPDQTKLVEIY
jgi:hypothetical protein